VRCATYAVRAPKVYKNLRSFIGALRNNTLDARLVFSAANETKIEKEVSIDGLGLRKDLTAI
jgi:hypothetical protein